MRRIPGRRQWSWVTAACVVSGCSKSGTDTGNPVWVSDCKSAEETKSSSASDPGRSYAQLTEEELPNGLECLLWETEPSGTVTFHMHNFSGACGAKWEGAVEEAGPASYRLRLTNTQCETTRCGGCVFDSDFSIDPGAAWDGLDASSATLALTREQFRCDDPENALASASWPLPLSSEPSGVRCEFVGMEAPDEPGEEFLPCAEEPVEPCSAELSCVDTGASFQRCLASCTTTDDCASAEITECRDGYCMPRGF